MSLLIGIGYAVTRKGLRGPGTRLDNGLERTPMDLRSHPRPAPQKSALDPIRHKSVHVQRASQGFFRRGPAAAGAEA